MSTLKIDELKNNGSAIDLPNGIKVGGNEIVQGYTSSGTEPASPATGDFWWDSTNELLYQYVNGEFKAIGITPPPVLDLANFSYDSVSFSVSGQESGCREVRFNADGTKMYIVGSTGNTVHQYSLSTASDLSTASYDSVSFSLSAQLNGTAGLNFNPDGTKMYATGYSNDTIYQYSLSTAYNVSTASYASKSFYVGNQEAAPRSIVFNADGTKMYVAGPGSDAIFEYDMSTAYDVSTASYNSVSLSVSSADNTAVGWVFNSDGTKAILGGDGNNSIFQYSLSTAYDLSTASYDSVSFSIASQETSIEGVTLNTDGTKMYIIGGNNTVYQYSTGL